MLIFIFNWVICFLFTFIFNWIICFILLSFSNTSDDKELSCNVGDPGLIPGLERSPGEENGNPLQCSWLENPMDREAWWVTVCGIAKSQTLHFLWLLYYYKYFWALLRKWLSTQRWFYPFASCFYGFLGKTTVVLNLGLLIPIVERRLFYVLHSVPQYWGFPAWPVETTIVLCYIWCYLTSVQFSSVAQSCLTLCNPESQHARPRCPSPTPGVHSSSCPSNQWCHSAISSSVIPCSIRGLFQWVNSSHEVAKVLEFQLQHQSFQWTPRTDFL